MKNKTNFSSQRREGAETQNGVTPPRETPAATGRTEEKSTGSNGSNGGNGEKSSVSSTASSSTRDTQPAPDETRKPFFLTSDGRLTRKRRTWDPDTTSGLADDLVTERLFTVQASGYFQTPRIVCQGRWVELWGFLPGDRVLARKGKGPEGEPQIILQRLPEAH